MESTKPNRKFSSHVEDRRNENDSFFSSVSPSSDEMPYVRDYFRLLKQYDTNRGWEMYALSAREFPVDSLRSSLSSLAKSIQSSSPEQRDKDENWTRSVFAAYQENGQKLNKLRDNFLSSINPDAIEEEKIKQLGVRAFTPNLMLTFGYSRPFAEDLSRMYWDDAQEKRGQKSGE